MKKVLFFIFVFVVVSYIITHYTKSNDVVAQQTNETPTEVTGDIVKIVNTNYTSSFSTTLKYPVKVEWWLTKAKMCVVDRQDDHFCADPKLPQSDLVNDYKGCGKLHKIDRGHMCPSADNRCSETLQTESCYFTNVAPQYANLNRGRWLRVEELSRKLAKANDSIHIWAGSKGSEGKMNSVTIPRYCWKVIYIKKLNKYRAFVFENTNKTTEGDYFDNEVTKDSVERFTGFKF